MRVRHDALAPISRRQTFNRHYAASSGAAQRQGQCGAEEDEKKGCDYMHDAATDKPCFSFLRSGDCSKSEKSSSGDCCAAISTTRRAGT